MIKPDKLGDGTSGHTRRHPSTEVNFSGTKPPVKEMAVNWAPKVIELWTVSLSVDPGSNRTGEGFH